jgi:hypothetical protein
LIVERILDAVRNASTIMVVVGAARQTVVEPGAGGTHRCRSWRQAMFLVGGDKAGSWSAWYRAAVPLADDRYTLHLKTLEGQR